MTLLREIPLNLIESNPDQPRTLFDAEALQGLADSIREVGLLQPILVRPNGNGGYQIIHGERRWRASRLAGMAAISAMVEDWSDAVAYTASVVENEQRVDLSPIETAQALRAMMDAHHLTAGRVGERIGRSRSWVAQKLRLLNLPDAVQGLVRGGQLTEAHGRQLLKLETAQMGQELQELARQAAAASWPVARLEAEVNTALARDQQEVAEHQGDEIDSMIALAFYAGALCVLRHRAGCLSTKATALSDTPEAG